MWPLVVSPWGPRPFGNSRDSHGLSFAERWLQNMKPCPAQPGLRPCREQLGCPMVSVLPAERGTMPSSTGLLTLSSSEQAERAVPTAGFFLALAGANGRLALFSVLCVKCPWRLSGVRGLWPHVYWLCNWSAGLLRVFGGSASAQGIYHDRRLAAAWLLCPTLQPRS